MTNFRKQTLVAEQELRTERKRLYRKWRDTTLVRLSRRYLNVVRYIRDQNGQKQTLVKTLERLLRGSAEYRHAHEEYERVTNKEG